MRWSRMASLRTSNRRAAVRLQAVQSSLMILVLFGFRFCVAAAENDLDDLIIRRLPGIMRTNGGNVFFEAPARDEVEAAPSQHLQLGDKLRTDYSAFAIVQFTNLSS